MSGLILLLFSYVLSQFYRSFLAVLAPVLTKELGVSATDLSNAAAAWFIVFALAQFPIGYWLDLYGPRRTAGYLLLIGGAGGIGVFALANSAFGIILAMALIGLGCAPVLMAAFFVFSHDYDAAKFATLAAIFVGVGTLGNVLGSAPLAAVIESFNWRSVATAMCVITVLVALGILALVKDPLKSGDSAQKGSLLDVLRIRQLWLIFPMIFMGYSLAAGIRGLWAGPYLSDLYDLTTLEIGQVTFYMALALVAGSFAYGPLDRIFNTRKWVVIGGYSALLVVALWFVMSEHKTVNQITIGFVLIGFLGAGYAVQMAHGKSFVPSHLVGRGVTLLNFFSIGGAGITQALSGFVMASGLKAGGLEIGYHRLFVFYAISLGLAILLYAFSHDAKPK